jgi:hypothetical protein
VVTKSGTKSSSYNKQRASRKRSDAEVEGIVAAVHHHEGRCIAASVAVVANVKDNDSGGRFSSNIPGIIAPSVATTTNPPAR